MNKEYIANVCENMYKECLKQIPQFEDNKLIWLLNGSTISNLLYNVIKIDEIKVSDQFKKSCYDFIRQPKGDIDITYVDDRIYEFDLDSQYIKEFQSVSEEQRIYNFVDSNSVLTNEDLEELCIMETKNGLKFMAKKPQYLFFYKYKEFLSLFTKEIIENDLESIYKRKKNIINDVVNLYFIAISYCGEEELENIIMQIKDKSFNLSRLYAENRNDYNKLIEASLNLIKKSKVKDEENKKI